MAAGAQAHSDDLVEAIGLATALRISACDRRVACVRGIVAAFAQLDASAPHLAPVARALIEPGLECALSGAQQVLSSIRADPAAPGLEEDYVGALDELGSLAAIFVGDFDAQPTREYSRLTATLTELMSAAEIARPVWRIIRRGQLVARSAPPPGPRHTEPLADPSEYYA